MWHTVVYKKYGLPSFCHIEWFYVLHYYCSSPLSNLYVAQIGINDAIYIENRDIV